jgi:hypothetical protein
MAGLRRALGGSLPDGRTPDDAVIRELVAAAGPGLVATPEPRDFGFVTGGALPSRWQPTGW